jgi:hypothetical protein
MGLFDFLRRKPTTTEDTTKKTDTGTPIEIANHFRLGDGSPLLVDERPDLSAIFTSPNPPTPQRITDKNRSYWDGESAETKRNNLAVAYLQHPTSTVRRATIGFAKDIKGSVVDQTLVNLLADADPSTQKAAAKALWSRQSDTNCEYALRVLRDEIRGHSKGILGTTGEFLMLGRDKAIRALDLLVAEAPDPLSRKAIQDMVDRDVIIEERLQTVDTKSVKFVGKEHKGNYVYEVYRADSKQQALAFLKTKEVHQKLYYIEVETPEGNFGRDIDGMYDV